MTRKPFNWVRFRFWLGIGLMVAVAISLAFLIVGPPPPWGDWRDLI